MGRYLDIARQFEARQRAEREAKRHRELEENWLCSQCGQPVTIDEVCRSLDGQRWLTLYHCHPCQLYGVTPEAVKEPPVWVKRTEQ